MQFYCIWKAEAEIKKPVRKSSCRRHHQSKQNDIMQRNAGSVMKKDCETCLWIFGVNSWQPTDQRRAFFNLRRSWIAVMQPNPGQLPYWSQRLRRLLPRFPPCLGYKQLFKTNQWRDQLPHAHVIVPSSRGLLTEPYLYGPHEAGGL